MMNCSNLTWVKNGDGKWNYVLTQNVVFNATKGIDFGYFKAYSDGNLVIRGCGDKLYVYKGYAWDGCTGIGKIYETEKTLFCSLLHDALYQVAKQEGYQASFTLKQADDAFLALMKNQGVCWFVRNAWYAGVCSIGYFWKLNKLDDLYIIS